MNYYTLLFVPDFSDHKKEIPKFKGKINCGSLDDRHRRLRKDTAPGTYWFEDFYTSVEDFNTEKLGDVAWTSSWVNSAMNNPPILLPEDRLMIVLAARWDASTGDNGDQNGAYPWENFDDLTIEIQDPHVETESNDTWHYLIDSADVVAARDDHMWGPTWGYDKVNACVSVQKDEFWGREEFYEDIPNGHQVRNNCMVEIKSFATFNDETNNLPNERKLSINISYGAGSTSGMAEVLLNTESFN